MEKLSKALSDVDRKVEGLKGKFEKTTMEAAKLKVELEKAQETIDAAENLVGKLEGEYSRWSGQVGGSTAGGVDRWVGVQQVEWTGGLQERYIRNLQREFQFVICYCRCVLFLQELLAKFCRSLQAPDSLVKYLISVLAKVHLG